MRNKNVLFLVQSAMIAAIYVVLTYFVSAFNLASGAIQIRISEALTTLPYFTPAAIPGLFLGCLLSNFLTGGTLWDIVFGSLATLLGAVGTRLLPHGTKKSSGISSVKKWLTPLPPIFFNTLIIPFVLYYAYRIPGSVPFFMLTVGIGELISSGIFGLLLLKVLSRYRKYLFPAIGCS